MNKNRLLLILSLAVGALSAEAQNFEIGVSLGATANSWYVSNTFAYPEINRNSIGISGVAANETATYQYNWGLDLGFPVKIAILEPVALHSGLFLSQKNIRSSINRNSPELEESIELDMSTYLLRMPLSLGYRFELGEHQSLSPNLGAYLAIGLGGDYTAEVNVESYTGEASGIEDRQVQGAVTYSTGIDEDNAPEYIFSNSYYLNLIDLGFHFGLKYRYRKAELSAAFNMGLVDTDPAILLNIIDDTQTNRYNRTLLLTAAYYF